MEEPDRFILSAQAFLMIMLMLLVVAIVSSEMDAADRAPDRSRFRSEATFYGVSREMRPRDWAGALPPLARKSGTRTEQQWR